MSRTLITLLGTGQYVTTCYRLEDHQANATPYVQVAVAELLGQVGTRADKIAVLLTDAAREKHWEELRRAFARLDYDEAAGTLVSYPIHDGKNESELWAVFEAVGRATSGAERVVLDATHAFRSLQLVTLLALTFFRNARGFELERVLYGAFETLGRADEVRRRFESTRVAETAPIFDLTEMLILPAWAEASSEWARTGNADRLLRVAHEPTLAMRKARGSDGLTTLVDRVRDVSHVLSLVRHADASHAAGAARDAAENATSTASDQGSHSSAHDTVASARLAPMRALAAQLADSLAPLARGAGDPGRLDRAYLESQLALARYYEERGRMLEAFSVLAELWTSCATRVALSAGLVETSGCAHKGVRKRWADAVRSVVNAQYQERGARDLRIRRAIESEPRIAKLFETTEAIITRRRNELDHCWVGSMEKWKRTLLDRVRDDHRQAAKGIEELLPYLDHLTPLEPVSPYFLNLSNHPSHEWSAAQRDSAMAFAPVIVDRPFPSVDPRATVADVQALARREVTEIAEGCTHALVTGELTLTFALIREMRVLGVECLAATGPRIVHTAADGSRISRFEFHGFRPYP